MLRQRGSINANDNVDLPTIWKAYVVLPKAIATGSLFPALNEIGQIEPTVTGAVKVVLLKVMA